MTTVSGLPGNRRMGVFVDKAGEGLVPVKSTCVTPPAASAPKRRSRRERRQAKPHPKTEITVSQQGFWADPMTARGKELWVIPVCVKAEGAKPFCQIFSQSAQTLPVAGCATWVFTNANASGYYRTQYDRADLEKLGSVATTELTASERISLLNDESALLGPGKESVARYLDLVGALSQDAERAVVESYSPELRLIGDYLVNDTNQAPFRAWIRATFNPMFAKIGWTPASGERAHARLLPTDLIYLLCRAAHDPSIMSRSVELPTQPVKNPHPMNPSTAAHALLLAARI